jgi:uncharacterized protein (TIGR04255 family)
MARVREHLRNAPIEEAVIDFRVLRQEHVSHETFDGLGSLIGLHYQKAGSIQSIQARFGVVDGKAMDPSHMQTILGWRYQTQAEVAQFRVDGFTFSKIKPYTTWEDVSGEAFRLWKVYLDLAKPREVSRVAVRYINRMRLPDVKDLGAYLVAPPQLPAPISQTIREFLTRVYVHDENRSASAVIVQALEAPLDPNTISLFLDIDAFREINESPNDPQLRSVFEQLRQLKNDIFFATITEKTAEIYA